MQQSYVYFSKIDSKLRIDQRDVCMYVCMYVYICMYLHMYAYIDYVTKNKKQTSMFVYQFPNDDKQEILELKHFNFFLVYLK